MTPETRIAMFVGLLFIVMFGLVLSELTGSPSPPASPTVRDERSPNAIHRVWSHDQHVAGKYAPVLLDQDPRPPKGFVDVGLEEYGDAHLPDGVVLHDPCSIVEVEVVRHGTPDMADPSAEMELIGRSRRPEARTYTVKPGDNLIKIARKEYGREHESQYKRILEANRDKITNERRLRVGVVLVIPPLGGQAPPAAVAIRDRDAEAEAPGVVLPGADAPPGYRIMDLEELRRSFLPADAREAVPAPPGSAGRYYTVREGDNLAKIAREVLNNSSHASVMRLYDANRDKLKDPDILPVGVKLTIPS